jgi:hypothetical protein
MRSCASRLTILACWLVSSGAWAQESADAPKPEEPPTVGLPAVPQAPPVVFPSQATEHAEVPLAGLHGGHVFVRDPRDIVRIYPSAWLRSDFYYAPAAPNLPAPASESAPPSTFGPSFVVRRILFDISGELFSRVAFSIGVQLGGARIGNTTFTGPETTSRFAMASAHDGKLGVSDVNVSYRLRRWLNFTAGQQLLPFSMSNRTREPSIATLERPLAIRGFVVPWDRDLGLTAWGEAGPHETLHYELGIFGGGGYEHPFTTKGTDFAGRIYSRPLSTLGKSAILAKTQIGFSARVGWRDQSNITFDYPTLATNQGWVLWQPGYVGQKGVVHVLPSGLQRALGGELRVPIDLPHGLGIDVQGEAYYVENNTRDAVDGFLTSTREHLGRVRGYGWYAQVSFWLLGQAFSNGDPGDATPVHMELRHPEPIKRGLELIALASGVSASYQSSARSGGGGDAPDDPNMKQGNMTVYQVGAGAQYWFGTNLRGGLHYMAYLAPGSGGSLDPAFALPGATNLVVLPANVKDVDGNRSERHVHHELAVRLAAGF